MPRNHNGGSDGSDRFVFWVVAVAAAVALFLYLKG
jgi:hypothetical protein